MNSPKQQPNWRALTEEIHSLPGFKLQHELLALDISISIFNDNFLELKNLINFVTTEAKNHELFGLRNREYLRTIQIDIVRRLHNFVASAMSLVDHTRNIYKKLEPDLFADYQTQIDSTFTHNPLVQFVHCLRQYCQHYRSPNIVAKLTLQRIEESNNFEEKRTVYLSRADLKEFSNWNSYALEYLNTLDEEVDILAILAQYQAKVTEFHQWFLIRQQEIHFEELKELKQKTDSFFQLQIEQRVNIYLNSSNTTFTEEELFISILSSNEITELERIDNLQDKLFHILKLLDQHFAIPEALMRKIAVLYRRKWLAQD